MIKHTGQTGYARPNIALVGDKQVLGVAFFRLRISHRYHQAS